jgi:hypothetical protein
MRSLLLVGLVLTCSGAVPNRGWAQFRVPAPRVVPPPRIAPPVHPPIHTPPRAHAPQNPPKQDGGVAAGQPGAALDEAEGQERDPNRAVREPGQPAVALNAAGEGGGPADSSLLPFALAVAGLVGGAGAAVAVWRRRLSPAGLVCITAPPPGEAPEHIRAAWVGLELPLARGGKQPRTMAALGAISDRAAGVQTGYVVDGRAAVERLAAHNPQAADWWREHAPEVLAPGYQFLFPTEVCHRLG